MTPDVQDPAAAQTIASTRRRKIGNWPWVVAVVVWIAMSAAALSVDRRVATAVHDRGIDAALHAGGRLIWLWKCPGTFGFTLAVVVGGLLVGWFNPRQAIFVVASGIGAGLDIFPKWIVGRFRPYKFPGLPGAQPFKIHPFCGGIYGFFHQRDLSFPSGHECSAWALAAAIAVLYPRVSPFFFLIAVAIGIERVLENAHYCSDVMAAIPVATLGCWIAWKLVRPRSPMNPLAP